MYSTSEFVPTRWEFWRVFQSWLQRTAVYRVGQRWHSGCGNARVYRKEAAGGSMCMALSGCLPCICLILVFSLTYSFFAFCHCLFFHSSGASHVRANIEPCTPQSSERQITRRNIPHSFFSLSPFFFLRRMALPPDDAKFFLPPARPLHIDSLTLAVWQPPPSFLRRLYSLW